MRHIAPPVWLCYLLLQLVNFLSSGPVVAMVWEGKEVVKYGRTMIGATNPLASAPGTIRGDYGIDVGRNIVHGSDSVEVRQGLVRSQAWQASCIQYACDPTACAPACRPPSARSRSGSRPRSWPTTSPPPVPGCMSEEGRQLPAASCRSSQTISVMAVAIALIKCSSPPVPD